MKFGHVSDTNSEVGEVTGLSGAKRVQQGVEAQQISIAMAPVSAAERAALDGFFRGKREQPTHGGRARMLCMHRMLRLYGLHLGGLDPKHTKSESLSVRTGKSLSIVP